MFLNKNKWITLIFTFLIFTVNAFAQGTTGQLSGTVTDPTGAIVTGASVKIISLDTNAERETATGDDGNFAFQLLTPGRYRIETTATGFRTISVEAVVNITQTTTVDVPLVVAGATVDPITVTAETPVLQTETSQNGRVITGETLRQLPLPTRNFQQLLTLSPGAQSSVSNTTELGRGDATISVNGQRTTSNTVRINGVDANSIGTNSTPNIAVPAPDSFQEFVVQTSLYDASFGRNAGGNVTLSVTAGDHRLKFGGEFRSSTVKFFFNAFTRGQLLFTSFNNFLTGTGTSLLGSGVFDRSFRVKDSSGFVQDDWKISHRLTLNLGLRYDFYGLPVEEQGRLVNFLPSQLRFGTTAAPAPAPNGFVQAEGGQLAGVPTVEKTLVPTDKNNFAPRVGFAYLLDENLKIHLKSGKNLLAVFVSMEKIPVSTASMGQAVSVNLTASKVLSLSKGMFGPLEPEHDNHAYDLHGIWQPVKLVVRGAGKLEVAGLTINPPSRCACY